MAQVYSNGEHLAAYISRLQDLSTTPIGQAAIQAPGQGNVVQYPRERGELLGSKLRVRAHPRDRLWLWPTTNSQATSRKFQTGARRLDPDARWLDSDARVIKLLEGRDVQSHRTAAEPRDGVDRDGRTGGKTVIWNHVSTKMRTTSRCRYHRRLHVETARVPFDIVSVFVAAFESFDTPEFRGSSGAAFTRKVYALLASGGGATRLSYRATFSSEQKAPNVARLVCGPFECYQAESLERASVGFSSCHRDLYTRMSSSLEPSLA